MPVAATTSEPLIVIAIFVIAVFAVIVLPHLRRRAWRERNRRYWDRKGEGRRFPVESWTERRDRLLPKQPDAADQLRIVMGADFTIQPILNKAEARVFRALDRAVIARNPTWQVMA